MAESRNYLDPLILNKITQLEVRARMVVEGFITGIHKSPYHGFAVEFATHREYVPGDEIRHIDWKVWARNDRLYVKEYEEETNLSCTIVLDSSGSMAYGQNPKDVPAGSRGAMGKYDYASTIAASLAFLLNRQQDAVGLVGFDERVRRAMPPSSHPSHLKRLINAMQIGEPDRNTDVPAVFHQLAEQVRRRSLVVMISDLIVDPQTLHESLSRFLSRSHDMMLFHVMHRDEWEFPFDDYTRFEGMEVDQQLTTEPRALRKAYLEELEKFVTQTRRVCSRLGVDYVPLSTSDALDAALSSYITFRQRAIRKARRSVAR